MANGCSNVVEFSGDLRNVNKCINLIVGLYNDCENGDKSVWSLFSYYEYFRVDGNTISYGTRDSSNVEQIVSIAKTFGVDFKISFDDNDYLGMYVFRDGVLNEYLIDDNDLEVIICDDDNLIYYYLGNEFEEDDYYEMRDSIYQDVFNNKFKGICTMNLYDELSSCEKV